MISSLPIRIQILLLSCCLDNHEGEIGPAKRIYVLDVLGVDLSSAAPFKHLITSLALLLGRLEAMLMASGLPCSL
jgi:hypothetical protein